MTTEFSYCKGRDRKLHNLQSIQRDFLRVGDNLWLRFNAGLDDQLWYYDSIVKILKKRLDNPIVSNLAETFESVRTLMRRGLSS